MNKLQERKQNNKGFSLVELIIVIAIMAVLVAILAPAFMRYVEESRQKADITAVDEVVQAAKAAYTNSEFKFSATSTSVKFVMKNAADPAIDAGVDGNFKKAMEASDVQNAQLKSAKWGDVTLTFKEATNGALTVDISQTKNGADDPKMKDKYGKK